jgi:hypothetical protein
MRITGIEVAEDGEMLQVVTVGVVVLLVAVGMKMLKS